MEKLLTKLGLYTKKQVLLSFELGVYVMDVCLKNKIELTKEKMERMEVLLAEELVRHPGDSFALQMPFIIFGLIQDISSEEPLEKEPEK